MIQSFKTVQRWLYAIIDCRTYFRSLRWNSDWGLQAGQVVLQKHIATAQEHHLVAEEEHGDDEA